MFKNISQEAVLKISDNTKFALPGQFVALFGVMYILNGRIYDELIVIGFIIHTILMLSRVLINYVYCGKKNIFLILYFISTTLSGIAWGSILFFITTLPAEYHLLIFAIFIGLVSGALFTLGEVLQLYLSYIIPILAMSVYWFLTQESTPIYIMTGYLSIFAFLYYVSAARKYNKSFIKALYEEKEKILLLKEIKDKSEVFEFLFEHSVMGTMIIEDGHFIQCNQKSVDMVGCESKDELLNITPDEISPQYQSDGRLSSEKINEELQIALDEGYNNFEWLHKRIDGKLFLVFVNLSSITLNGKKVLYASWRDITQEKKLKNDLKHLAHHDNLTGLPNRMLYCDRLEQAIIKAQRGESQLAVLFIDLDKFKPINDTYGHEVGDEVLIEVSRLLKNQLRKEDTLARLGGDEFTVVLENIQSQNNVSLLAQKLIDVLIEPVNIDKYKFNLSLSIGISIYPQDSTNSKELLKLADMAMYKAKDAGRNNYKFYKE